jgi:hypothetical protein
MIAARKTRTASLDADELIPRTQENFRLDQVAEIFCVSVSHLFSLIKEGELTVPKENIKRAVSRPGILVPRDNLVRFVKRRRNSPTRLLANKRRRQRLKGGQR